MLVKFEQSCIVRTTKKKKKKKKKELFDRKKKFYHFWQSVDAVLEDVSVAETIFLTLNYEIEDYHLSVFQNLR